MIRPLLHCACALAAAAVNVQIGLQAAWPAIPPASHAIEFLRQFDPVAAAQVLQPEGGVTGDSILSNVEQRLDAEALRLFAFLLQIQYFAPEIESQRAVCRELRPESCAGAVVIFSNGTLRCGAAVLNGPKGDSDAKVQIGTAAPAEAVRLASDLLLQERYGAQGHVVICADISKVEQWLPLVKAFPGQRVFFRHGGGADTPGTVFGHGVELRIKNSEYSALLDDADDADDSDEGDGEPAEPLTVGDLQVSAETRPLSQRQLSRVQLQAVRYVVRSRDPLESWQHLVENFPALAAGLAATKRPTKQFRKAADALKDQFSRTPPYGSLYLGGREVPLDAPFLRMVDRLWGRFLAPGTGPGVSRIDWTGITAQVSWDYDVMKHEDAEGFPSRLQSLLSTASQEQFWGAGSAHRENVEVRVPLFHVFVVVDPYDVTSLKKAKTIFANAVSGRIAVAIFADGAGAAGPSDTHGDKSICGSLLTGAFVEAFRNKRGSEFVAWAIDHHARLVNSSTDADIDTSLGPRTTHVVDEDLLKTGFLLEGHTSRKKATQAWSRMVSKGSGNCVGHNAAAARELGLAAGEAMINGRVVPGGATDVKDAIQREQRALRAAVAGGSLRDGKKASATQRAVRDFLLRGSGPAPYHPRFTPAVSSSRESDKRVAPPKEIVAELPTVGDAASGSPVAVLFVSSRDLGWLRTAATWAVGGFGRLALVVSVALGDFSRCLRHAFAALPASDLADLTVDRVEQLCPPPPQHGHDELDVEKSVVKEAMLSIAVGVHNESAWMCGERRVVLPEHVPYNGLKLLQMHGCPAAHEPSQRSAETQTAHDDDAFAQDSDYTALEKAVTAAPREFTLAVPGKGPRLLGVVDPLSDSAPTIAAAVKALHKRLDADVRLLFVDLELASPGEQERKQRLRKWSRSALESGSIEIANLRTADTLEFAFNAPPSWVISPWEAQEDLDNLRATAASANVTAHFALEGLLVEGRALQSDAYNEPAKGLQVELLSSGSDAVVAETRAMAAEGYFSLAAPPGVYRCTLKPGASDEVFALASAARLAVSSWLPPDERLLVRLKPGKKPGDLFAKTYGKKMSAKRRRRKQRQQLSHSKQQQQQSVTKFVNGEEVAIETADGSEGVATAESPLPTVHVFSVASGHLYEKLLTIMIASLRKHTRCRLHFWFLDSFMSPLLKSQLPHFASTFDFTYQLVSFSWPSWLRDKSGNYLGIWGQKQRLIWAYKILFLDVLFPLDLDRILFVDADIIVRGDVLDLWNTDMQGAVYGFVPFCREEFDETSSATVDFRNKDTLGFRFWEAGFWRSHLRSHFYHISALFLVDLGEFRRRSVGDTLRSTYQGLAGSPDSLSNLDQDLPNYIQDQVPIFPLPREWLWCESWCNATHKPAAKMIDLCQNPLTKESKLTMARRVVPEWAAYHEAVSTPTTPTRDEL